MSKVIVIGAGHGGLAAAARLRVKGHEVSVFNETASPITTEQPLTLLGAYRDLFLKTGNSLEENIELNEVESALSLQLENNKSIEIPGSGIGRSVNQIESILGRAAGDQWRNYITKVGKLWLKIRQPLVENRDANQFSILRKIGPNLIWQFRSLTKLHSNFLPDPDLLRLAWAYREQVNVASECDFGLLAINAYVQQNFGVYLPTEGLPKLGSALVERCDQLGVQFEMNSVARPVELNGQICGIETSNNSFVAADFVILNSPGFEMPNASWFQLPDAATAILNFFEISELSWLGIGPAQAVLTGEAVANRIGSAS